MDYVRFGRTELQASVMGLGCGGPSRIGQNGGVSEADSVNIIRAALDAGVNFIDTAEVYGTEGLVGDALKHVQRDSIIISTKKSLRQDFSPQSLRQGLEHSLKKLGTDYVDIYNLHGLSAVDYLRVKGELLPTFDALKQEGKIRFTGVSEMFNDDKGHQMLQDSLPEDPWDVVMVGFNILNQTARETVFAHTRQSDVAVQIMFAVRRVFSQPAKLIDSLRVLVDEGQLSPEDINLTEPLNFVMAESDATSLADAAYRFCRYESGVHVVLSGTGNQEHLKDNIDSMCKPPLPEAVTRKLRHIFRHCSAVTGQ